MSEPVTNWRPLIEFDESERRIGRAETAPAAESAAFAEFIPFAGERGEGPVEAAAEDGAQAAASGPVIRGDFAAIEAALLGAARPGAAAPEPAELHEAPAWARLDLRASRADADFQASPFPALFAQGPDAPEHPAAALPAMGDGALYADAGAQADNFAPSDNFMLFDDAAVSGGAAMADEEKRSRRPIYIMAALVLAGLAGITATSLRRDGAGDASQDAFRPAAFTPVAESAPATTPDNAQAAAETSAPAPAQQALATAAGSEQTATGTPAQQALAPEAAPASTNQAPVETAAAPAADAAPRVISLNEPAGAPGAPAALPPVPPAPSEIATGSILAPPPPGQAQALTDSSVKAAIGEAKKVKTAAVRPDGSLVNPEPPATRPASQEAMTKEAPATAAPSKQASAKDAAAKAAKVAHLKAQHPGAAVSKTAAAPVKAAPAAVAAKAKPAANEEAQATPASPPPAAVAQDAAPKPTGALAFVDTAVSSITGATGKLLDWGRTASSSLHN